MITRRRFLKFFGGAVTVTASPILFEACASGLATHRYEFDGSTITIPKAEAQKLMAPNGVMMIQPANLPLPIVLRNLPNQGLIALSMICTHKGCEVRVLPDGFQCPCHGSEYLVDGAVVEGPASRPLQRFAVEETQEAITIKVEL